MSHIVQIQTQVKDAAAVRAGSNRLQLDAPVEGEVRLFSQTVSGLAVRLREWRYPVVFNLTTGESKFDNYGGHWVKQERLDEFLQVYSIEKTKIEARRKGYSRNHPHTERLPRRLVSDTFPSPWESRQ